MYLLNKVGTLRAPGRRPADPPLARLRVALTLVFVLHGFVFAGWVSRIPAIKSQIGASPRALGGLVAPHLSPIRHLMLLVPLGVLITAMTGPTILRRRLPGANTSTDERDRSAWQVTAQIRWVVVLFGLIAVCDTYGEGSLADWGALHLRDDLGATQGLAAAGFSAFSFTQAVGRMYGRLLLESLGETRVLFWGGVTASAGLLTGALASHIWLVFVGYAVAGLGLSNIFPTAIARAGALRGPNGVALAATLGYGGFLLGPPTIGFLADAFGLPTALVTLALLAALAAVIAYSTRNTGSLSIMGSTTKRVQVE